MLGVKRVRAYTRLFFKSRDKVEAANTGFRRQPYDCSCNQDPYGLLSSDNKALHAGQTSPPVRLGAFVSVYWSAGFIAIYHVIT